MLSSSPSSASSLPPHRSGSLSSCPGNHTVFTPTSSPSEKLTLTEFVSQYHKSLPLPIRVCRGYCGPSEETSISEGDHFNVHFVKHTTVVLVEMDNGYQYNVPLNSAVPFGILYDPQRNLSQASKGYTFQKASDILALPELPHVLRARKAHSSSNPENSISANELLIVRSAAKKRIGKNQLKVFSLTDKREKTLSESCIGHFSTKPRDVCLYLPDIVKHAPDIFPVRAILFAGKEGAQTVPSKLASSAVTLMHHSIETSLVVTSAIEDEGTEKMLDIPIDLNIQVRVATVTEVEAQKLARSTAYLYNNFSPAKLLSYVRSARTQGMEDTQNLLYRTIRHDRHHLRRGINITRPQSMAIPDRDDPSAVSSSPSSYPTGDIYDDIVPLDDQSEPHYMTPRPASTATTPEGPPLPDRNQTHKRTPGYSYVDIDDMRRCTPNRATRAVGPSAVSVGTCDRAPDDSSFGSTGSGGAVVERLMSELPGGAGGRGKGSEYSSRSSYSEGDLEVRRQQVQGEEREREREERESLEQLDTFLNDLKDMTDGLESVLQPKKEEKKEEEGTSYSTLQHRGPQRKTRYIQPLHDSPFLLLTCFEGGLGIYALACTLNTPSLSLSLHFG